MRLWLSLQEKQGDPGATLDRAGLHLQRRSENAEGWEGKRLGPLGYHTLNAPIEAKYAPTRIFSDFFAFRVTFSCVNGLAAWYNEGRRHYAGGSYRAA